MVEYEKKLMLTEQEYNCLRQFKCKNTPSVFQTNYYFDNDEFSMNKRGITYRIRYKNGIYKATVKNHGVKNSDCNVEVDLSEKNYFDLNAFLALGAHLQGNLVTERIVMFKDSDCEIVLDCNIYLGVTDYEIEIEYFEMFEEKATRLLGEITEVLLLHGFAAGRNKVQSKSKSERFFERKAIQKG